MYNKNEQVIQVKQIINIITVAYMYIPINDK